MPQAMVHIRDFLPMHATSKRLEEEQSYTREEYKIDQALGNRLIGQ